MLQNGVSHVCVCEKLSTEGGGSHFFGGVLTSLKKYRAIFERGEKTPTPKISALLRKRPVVLRANFVLTKDRKRPYYGHFCGTIHREASCSKAAGVLSKVQMLNLVLGVGSSPLFRDMGYRSDNIAVSRDMGPLSPHQSACFSKISRA